VKPASLGEGVAFPATKPAGTRWIFDRAWSTAL